MKEILGKQDNEGLNFDILRFDIRQSAVKFGLTEEFGKVFSLSSLQLMRQFFLEFSLQIHQTPSVDSTPLLRKPPTP